MESVVINEPTVEENISLEQQAAMQDEAAAQKQAQQQPLEEQPVEQTSERPEWLPEKFESAEALAEAYANLERDFHASREEAQQQTEAAEDVNTPEPSELVSNTVNDASTEYFETGQLSDKTYADLEKAGISRELVDMYIEGYNSVSNQQANALKEEVGGEENYSAMADWAATALTDDEQEVFNNVVESGDQKSAVMAIRGLYARFIADGGQPAKLIQGETAGAGVTPFGSTAQVVQAMNDPRYADDPAYRAHIEKRLAISSVI
jgi:hypothetical protein